MSQQQNVAAQALGQVAELAPEMQEYAVAPLSSTAMILDVANMANIMKFAEFMAKGHMPQVQGVMWVLGLEQMDFCSFDPRMPPELRLYVERVARNDGYIKDLEDKVLTFLAEVQIEVNDFLKMGLAA
jgi:hypothetical protein